jgi:large subunit ribosomal protein L3
MKFSFAKKIGMTQMFEGGKVIPVTRVQLYSDTQVDSIKTQEVDGYESVRFGAIHTKKVKDKTLPKLIREVRLAERSEYNPGDVMSIEQYQSGDIVKVKGISKGKGFAGVVKRHGFAGANATHGTKHTERSGGSIGSGYPEHVLKGRKMPGRHGYKMQTIKGVKVMAIDTEKNELLVKGALPGPKGGLLQIVG